MVADKGLTVGSFPLAMAGEGDRVKVVMHKGGRGTQQRLRTMGLRVDSNIEILQRLGGSLVVMVNDIRFALGAGMAQKIMVIPQ